MGVATWVLALRLYLIILKSRVLMISITKSYNIKLLSNCYNNLYTLCPFYPKWPGY